MLSIASRFLCSLWKSMICYNEADGGKLLQAAPLCAVERWTQTPQTSTQYMNVLRYNEYGSS